jgi:hypothetical protein
VRLIDALEKAFSLLVFGQVEVELDYPGTVAVQMFFQPHDGVKSAFPDRLLVKRSISKSFSVEDLGVHADDQHLLVIGSIEDADPSPFRQVPRVVRQRKSCCNSVALGCL